MTDKIKDLISKMTLEEKAGMCSGEDFWHLKGIERLDIESVMVTDGPHGLRKQADKADHLGINDSIEAVCFPTAVGTASSFDRDLLKSMGEVLGNECQAENVSVLLGPGVNIKRSPLCGRNFEYFSEDPYLTGELAASFINGVQSKNVGTSMKHYAVNNQETRRMTSSSNLDERTLREIYLVGFEAAVKNADPWTIMSSYNRLNGVYCSESKKLLTDILRDEWGFNGYVVTDWGGTNNRVMGLGAGEDLQMPGNGGFDDKKIIAAVKDGSLDEKVLDKAVSRILDVIFRFVDNRDESAVFDRAKDHDVAGKVAEDTMVLLKNENNILPLNPSSKIAFIGDFAETPRYQGSGSSHINSHKVVGALDAVKDIADVTFAKGYTANENEVDEKLQAQAIKAASDAEVAVIFAGLPDSFESEGFDRTHLNMPQNQLALIDEIIKVQKNIIIVLHNGSPVAMPWLGGVDAVLESYLAGEAVGEAQVNILFGKANPSAKLAETFPLKLEHNPSYPNFPGEKDVVNYTEGIFVGYRYYDTKKIDVLFPFGHGLSYTNYEYSNLAFDKEALASNDDTLKVSLDVTNTGKVAGKEIVQLYVTHKDSPIIKAEKELKNFVKVSLQPGETKTVTMVLDFRSFAHYDEANSEWNVLSGEYDILIGKSSRDIVLSKTLTWTRPPIKGFRVNDDTTIGDLFEHPVTAPIVQVIMAQFKEQSKDLISIDEDSDMLGGAGAEMMYAMMQSMPVRALRSFGGEQVAQMYEPILAQLNAALEESEK